MEIETVDDVLAEIADMLGIRGGHDDAPITAAPNSFRETTPAGCFPAKINKVR